MNTIKAIETSYRGYRMRSRLEARWACFFDALGWDWKYEHQGYVIGQDTPWLPDFEISTPDGGQFYVEVKGDHSFFNNGFFGLLDFGAGPSGFPDSARHCPTRPESSPKESVKPLLILGNIPQGNGILGVPIFAHDKGICLTWGVIGDRNGIFYSIDRAEWQMESCANLPDLHPTLGAFYHTLNDPVNQALDAARSARFEHGERP